MAPQAGSGAPLQVCGFPCHSPSFHPIPELVPWLPPGGEGPSADGLQCGLRVQSLSWPSPGVPGTPPWLVLLLDPWVSSSTHHGYPMAKVISCQ